jgi:hypothetical protein
MPEPCKPLMILGYVDEETILRCLSQLMCGVFMGLFLGPEHALRRIYATPLLTATHSHSSFWRL